ncbi:pilin [Patescibacteria group bacterium]|nr:pilin [Patescibacteria group bacterium]
MMTFLTRMIPTALGAPPTSGDAIISKPAGSGILPGAGVEGSDIQSSVLFVKIIPFLISWAINLTIGLAVLALIAGGYMYLTAYGDTEKHDRARRTLTYAIIGLILALTAYGIVAIVTSIRIS